MKNIFCILLAMLLLATIPAFAEEPAADNELVFEVTYEAVEVQLPQSEWMIHVPVEWMVVAEDYEPAMSIGNQFSIHIECSILDSTFEEVYESIARGVNFKEDFVTCKTINGFPVMTYRDEWEYIDLGNGMLANFRISLVKPFLQDYEGTREMVYQMIGSLHLPEAAE